MERLGVGVSPMPQGGVVLPALPGMFFSFPGEQVRDACGTAPSASGYL